MFDPQESVLIVIRALQVEAGERHPNTGGDSRTAAAEWLQKFKHTIAENFSKRHFPTP
jgi:hypothetical protein